MTGHLFALQISSSHSLSLGWFFKKGLLLHTTAIPAEVDGSMIILKNSAGTGIAWFSSSKYKGLSCIFRIPCDPVITSKFLSSCKKEKKKYALKLGRNLKRVSEVNFFKTCAIMKG